MISLLCAAVYYLGVSGSFLMPQGGSEFSRAGGLVARGGAYVSDDFALEASAGAIEKYASLGARGLYHLQGFELYNRFFGYSRFDPFATIGVAGLIGSERGQVGPEAGLGAFYHFDDHWSLRFDMSAALGLESRREMLYNLSVGVQWEF